MKSIAVITAAVAVLAACHKQRRPGAGGREENVDLTRPTYGITTREGTTEVGQLYRLAGDKLWADDVAGARELYDAALRAEPANPAAHVGLGSCALHVGELETARAHYQAALAMDANWVSAHVGLGTVASRQGNNQEALAEYETAIRLDGKDADAHWGAAGVSEEMGNRDKMRRYAARFLVLAPESALAPRARAMLLR